MTEISYIIEPKSRWYWIPFKMLGAQVQTKPCGLGFTDDDVVVKNSEETHTIAKAGAEAAIVEEDAGDAMTTMLSGADGKPGIRRLYIRPADAAQHRVIVEAGEGLTPARLDALVKQLNDEFRSHSV